MFLLLKVCNLTLSLAVHSLEDIFSGFLLLPKVTEFGHSVLSGGLLWDAIIESIRNQSTLVNTEFKTCVNNEEKTSAKLNLKRA
jgi:hypothetical protein